MSAFVKLFEKDKEKNKKAIEKEFKAESSVTASPLSLLERVEKLEASNRRFERMHASLQQAYDELSASKEQERQRFQLRVENLEKIVSKFKMNTSAIPHIEQQLVTITAQVQELKSESNKTMNDMKKLQTLAIDNASLGVQLKKLKSKYKTMKEQMFSLKVEKDTASLVLAKKVANLERLRKILNGERLGARATGPGLRQSAISDDGEHLTATSIPHGKPPPVGFTAQLPEVRDITKNSHINKLFRVINNSGGCFKPYQGHFVAPSDGLYCFCVKLEQDVNQNFVACLMVKKRYEPPKEKYDIRMFCDVPHSALCTLDLCASDRVFVKILSTEGRGKLDSSFTFSGWSLGYY
ncbi:hypothetical protein EGW08_014746 [Elysia chlorotica]|uniref:C1q domain-containing protein n=1 Tax=Elysia chlorotica TaxID=188477 RepID=A0A3S1HE37_ELYCH|nr:hypothetical protein EGW08_014746 [Elysia chlorotica]